MFDDDGGDVFVGVAASFATADVVDVIVDVFAAS